MAIELPTPGTRDVWGKKLNAALTKLDQQTVVGASVNSQNHLIVTKNNGTSVDAGDVNSITSVSVQTVSSDTAASATLFSKNLALKIPKGEKGDLGSPELGMFTVPASGFTESPSQVITVPGVTPNLANFVAPADKTSAQVWVESGLWLETTGVDQITATVDSMPASDIIVSITYFVEG